MQVSLSEVPFSETAWEIWARAHRASHDLIRQTIRARTGVDLPDYPLEPLEQNDIGGFLQRNQRMHVDMNGVLRLNNVDLSSADFSDPEKLEAWIFLHWNAHRDAEKALGVGS